MQAHGAFPPGVDAVFHFCVMIRAILLGSSSPRRRVLLDRVGIPISRMVSPEVPEPSYEGGPLDAYVLGLARRKLEWIRRHALPSREEMVLTADTVVVLDGKVLGKPLDAADAVRMLRALRGRTHQVFTACVMSHVAKMHASVDRVSVTFNDFSDEDIEHYVGTGAPLDKAGAYGAQDRMGLIAIRKIEGSFYTVMGLPVDWVYKIWRHREA